MIIFVIDPVGEKRVWRYEVRLRFGNIDRIYAIRWLKLKKKHGPYKILWGISVWIEYVLPQLFKLSALY